MMTGKWWALAVLVALQVADAVSTRLALAHGAVELNPIVLAIGLGPAKLVVIVVVVLLALRTRRVWLLWYGCGLYSLIVANNLFLGVR